LHNALAQRVGADFAYLAFEVTRESLPDFVKAARTLPIAGFNVTMPLKQAIIPLLDSLDPLAERCGAVNTVVNRGGALIGYNTDCEGFIASLEGDWEKLRTPLLLGTGGAASAIRAAFAAFGVDAPMVSVRDRAGELSSLAANADIVVNATSLGMRGSAQFADFDWLRGTSALVYDLVYDPVDTELLTAARALGLRTVGGLELLTRQAELAFFKFASVV
jgi:shikimate dehydrogenase